MTAAVAAQLPSRAGRTTGAGALDEGDGALMAVAISSSRAAVRVSLRGLVAAVWLVATGCEAHVPPAGNAPEIGPEAVVAGPRTRTPSRSYPTELTVPESYGRAWDATAAVLASRGFPLDVSARDSGVFSTGWRVTQPNHEVQIGAERYVGRKVERLTVLVRPVEGGTRITITSQAALASPRWSAAAPAPGHAVDLPVDTVTEYGLLFDIATVLGHPRELRPDPAYATGLSRSGVVAPAGAGGGR
jgi:hypothetical protein